MKAIIFCFSGTGNTKKIAKLWADEFEREGVGTTLFDVTGDMQELPDPNDFDKVGFAYPIHAFNAPHIMLDLAKKLVKAKDKKEYFILKSSGEPLKLNNISSYKFSHILRRKGYKLSSEYHYVMPYNMIFRHTADFATKMWSAASRLAPIEAREYLGGKIHKLAYIPFGNVIAFIMRIEHPAMRVNGRIFKIDENKCVKCGKCVKACPMQNIKLENGKFTFGGDCLMCARCSFNCPTDAFNIALLNGWRVNGKYDLNYAGEPEKNVHKRYCRRSYAKYFENAQKKIESYREKDEK